METYHFEGRLEAGCNPPIWQVCLDKSIESIPNICTEVDSHALILNEEELLSSNPWSASDLCAHLLDLLQPYQAAKYHIRVSQGGMVTNRGEQPGRLQFSPGYAPVSVHEARSGSKKPGQVLVFQLSEAWFPQTGGLFLEKRTHLESFQTNSP
jgi:hypothetical protein